MTLLLIVFISMALAAIMSAVAWHSSREEQRRSDTRIAALAAEIHDETFAPATVAGGGDLFAAPQRSAWRYATVVAAGSLICSSVVALAIASSPGAHGVASTIHTSPANPATLTNLAKLVNPGVPIELMALGHERDGDRLTVRGIVRNPSSGAALNRVTAVVLLFKPDGGFLNSGRAIVESPALGPGGETAFAVTVPGSSGVGRYRVSFRTEGRVVPHIDRRSRT